MGWHVDLLNSKNIAVVRNTSVKKQPAKVIMDVLYFLKKWDFKIILSFMALYELQWGRGVGPFAIGVWSGYSSVPFAILFIAATQGNEISFFAFLIVFSVATYSVRSRYHDLPEFYNPDGARPRYRDTRIAAVALVGVFISIALSVLLPRILAWTIR